MQNNENEQKKMYLKSYRRSVKREQDILEEIQKLREDEKFPLMEENQDDYPEFKESVDELIEELKEERLAKIRRHINVKRKIDSIKDDDEREVLRLRYIEGLKWEEVAVEIGYSWRRTHDIHSNALKHLSL